ncbi:hypothetical protein AV530_013691 [Patagioenas fasciata monilis]|uniref:Uncharacterized protein n=1 Tax=Patagioenas fasciata monilis TaxID=372326 RepID=A0A1V4J822_PATFA|nr:hypothetical protein AV530_013691 [Patagioenas fasciata monilis]
MAGTSDNAGLRSPSWPQSSGSSTLVILLLIRVGNKSAGRQWHVKRCSLLARTLLQSKNTSGYLKTEEDLHLCLEKHLLCSCSAQLSSAAWGGNRGQDRSGTGGVNLTVLELYREELGFANGFGENVPEQKCLSPHYDDNFTLAAAPCPPVSRCRGQGVTAEISCTESPRFLRSGTTRTTTQNIRKYPSLLERLHFNRELYKMLYLQGPNSRNTFQSSFLLLAASNKKLLQLRSSRVSSTAALGGGPQPWTRCHQMPGEETSVWNNAQGGVPKGIPQPL